MTSSIEYGAILVVSAIDGIMSQTAEQIMIAHHMGMQHIVVFMNKCDMVDDMETLDITIELIQPIKITEEEPFIIRDDECTVGLGRVATIIE